MTEKSRHKEYVERSGEKPLEQTNPSFIADHIRLHDQFITAVDTKEMYRWNGQYWEENGKEYIEEQCSLFMGKSLTKNAVSEVITHFQFSTYVNREDLETPNHLLNLKNGILNLETRQLENFEESIYFLSQNPLVFDPEIDCPKFKKFLNEVLSPEDIPVIQELFGYCFWKVYHIHKAFILIGPGRNGKTTLLRILQQLLGNTNCENLTLQRLEYSGFAPGELYGKLANISLELPTTKLTHATTFKGLTGQDIVSTDVKHKKGFSFLNYAKLIFACNTLPASKDDTDAFKDRFILIQFPNQFLGKKADKKLLKKLTTPEELTGILNWALEGLERLLENGEFSFGLDLEEIRVLYERLSEPTVAFIEDIIIETTVGEEKLFRQDALFAYKKYCRENKLSPDGKITFYEKMREHLGHELRGKKGDRREHWLGYTLKEEYQPEYLSSELKNGHYDGQTELQQGTLGGS